MDAPKKVILHCAATPDYRLGDARYDRFGASDIAEWHLERGFKQIGYHHVIRRSGVLEAGRPETIQGAHCEGHNGDSLGVCYVGTKHPTLSQWRSILGLARAIKARHGLGPDAWFGHYEFNPGKICPGVPMERVREWLTKWL